MCFAPQRRALFRHFFDIWTSKSGPRPSLLEVAMLKKCTPLWREAHFQVKMYKTPQLRTTFGSWDVEKVHAVVARSTFPSQKCPRMVCFVHFDLEMCFAPQRRAIFHLSSSQLAPHPPALASLLFGPPEPQIIGKTQCFATFLPFRASESSVFLLFLF